MTQSESNAAKQIIRSELLNSDEERVSRIVEDKYYLPKEAIKILIEHLFA